MYTLNVFLGQGVALLLFGLSSDCSLDIRKRAAPLDPPGVSSALLLFLQSSQMSLIRLDNSVRQIVRFKEQRITPKYFC